jgi:alkaline phosphatase
MVKKTLHPSFTVILLGLILFLPCISQAEPKNLIFCIGDGMGPQQVKAAGVYLYGEPNKLSFESLPYSGVLTTRSADNAITDSAAAGTALATGTKVNNGVISTRIPGDGKELQTLLEFYKAGGRSTGLITTSYLTDATPSAFGAHESSRNNTSQIANDFLLQTQVNVLMGGGGNGMTAQAFRDAGYTVVTDAVGLLAVDTENTYWLSGQFGSGQMRYEADGIGDQPHLSEMALIALNILQKDPNGFFLMVEGGNIDHAGHSSLLRTNIFETIEFSDTVQLVLEWAAERDDTLVLVTADHETGGLNVVTNNGAGILPTVTWSGGGQHTAANVPVFAVGVNSEAIDGIMDNTDMFGFCTATHGLGAWLPDPADGAVNPALSAILRWAPQGEAYSHDIYFGDNFDDVNDGAVDVFLGNKSDRALTVGLVDSVYPAALVPGETYYWRIDEVNELDPNDIIKGQVWNFIVPAITSWNPQPADEETLVDPNVILKWSAGLDASSHRLYFGENYSEVLSGAGDTNKGSILTTTYKPTEALIQGKTYYWRVDEYVGSGRSTKIFTGDIWSFTVKDNL